MLVNCSLGQTAKPSTRCLSPRKRSRRHPAAPTKKKRGHMAMRCTSVIVRSVFRSEQVARCSAGAPSQPQVEQ